MCLVFIFKEFSMSTSIATTYTALSTSTFFSGLTDHTFPNFFVRDTADDPSQLQASFHKSALKHISEGTYLGILAMCLEVLAEHEERQGTPNEILTALHKELRFLHQGYKVVKRDE